MQDEITADLAAQRHAVRRMRMKDGKKPERSLDVPGRVVKTGTRN